MASNSVEIYEEFFYDFRKVRTWYKTFAGIGSPEHSKLSRLHMIHRFFAILFLAMMTLMFFVTAIITTDYLAEFAEAFHYSVVLLSMVIYFPIVRYAQSDIEETFQKLKKSFYSYNGELNEAQKEIKQKVIRDIKFYDKLFFWMLIFACTGYIILTPLMSFFYPELTKVKRSEFTDKRLPIPFYIPIVDRYGISFCIVFLMESCCNLMVHSLITSIHEAYISIIGQIYGEMKLLNYSIKHIEERALKLSRLEKGQYNVENISKSQIYQRCFMRCLKEDILHHKTILDCIKLVRPFAGRIIISVFTLCSVLWAVGGYVMMKMLEQGTGLDKVLEFCFILFAEWIYVFDMCLFTEKVKSESDQLFSQIYSIRWYHCNTEIRQSIYFMLMNTSNPSKMNKNLFNVSASFETFLSLVSAAFSYINLLRSINK